MSVKIRLTRRGRKKLALYDIIVADSRSPRDGKFIEKLGTYNPGTHPVTVKLNEDKAFGWLMNGALPTDTVRELLSEKGVMYRKHLQIGVNKGAIKQEDADKKLADWKSSKEAAVIKKQEDLKGKKDSAKKDKLAAEAKANEKRKEAIASKKSAAAALVEAEANKTPEASAEPAQETAETPKEE
ncbi:MAG: 30S ribosomal protein S16 [Cytophagaceae bacterium]